MGGRRDVHVHACVHAWLCMHVCPQQVSVLPPLPAPPVEVVVVGGVPALAAPQVPLPRGLFAVNIHVFLSPGRLFSQ